MLEPMTCCGVTEATYLDRNTPLNILKGWWEDLDGEYNWHKRFIIFIGSTENGSISTAKKVEKMILANNLGAVTKTKRKINPNTGNDIRVYVWDIHLPNFKKFGLKHGLTHHDLYW